MKINNSCQTILCNVRERTPDYLLRPQKKPSFFLNILKNKKIISENIKNMCSRNKFKKNNSQLLTVKIKSKKIDFVSRNSKQELLPKICPYSYRYFYKEKNKNLIHKSTFNVNSIETSKSNMESNFMQLMDESNIYTSNVKYISNKKIVLLDKFKFDNNIYKPDRLKLHEMSQLPPPKIKLKKINFRHILFKRNDSKKDNSETLKNVFDM